MRTIQRAELEGTRLEILRGDPGISRPPSLSTEDEDLQDLQRNPLKTHGQESDKWTRRKDQLSAAPA